MGHRFKCPICAQAAPDLKSMQVHHEARHPKLPFEPEKCALCVWAACVALMFYTRKTCVGVRISIKPLAEPLKVLP